jgi:hypothetical protein
MLITFEYLNKFKTSNRIFEGRNISLEATKILNEQKYRVEKEYDIFYHILLKMQKLSIFYILIYNL